MTDRQREGMTERHPARQIYIKSQTERRADRQIDREKDGHTNRATYSRRDIQRGRSTYTQLYKKDIQTDRYTDIQRETDRARGRQTNRQIDREKDRHTNRATYSRTDRQLVVRARPRQIDIKQVVIRYLIDAWLVNLQLRRLTESTESSPSAGPGQYPEPELLSSICSPLYISDPQTARPGRFQFKKTQGASAIACRIEVQT